MKRNLLLIIFIFVTVYSFSGNSSLNFLNNVLNNVNLEVDKSYERLSGGKILLRDDPANYAIYEKLEAVIRETDKIVNNSNDLISYYKYMEAILSSISDSLQRIRELLVQRSSGLLDEFDKKIIDNEINQYYKQIEYYLNQAEFNKKKVFDDLLNDIELKSYFKKEKYYDFNNIEGLLNFVIKQRAVIGAIINRVETRIYGEEIKKENTVNFQSHGDTDFSSEISILKKNSLLFLINILLL